MHLPASYLLVACGTLLLAGCVTAPRQTVELADVVAQQSASLESAHRKLVQEYFNALEGQIDDFVDNTWTPNFLARAVASPQVRKALAEARAGLAVNPDRLRATVKASKQFSSIEATIIVKALKSAQLDYRSQFGQIMIDFSKAALVQIDAERRKLKAPLEENRRKLLAALDQDYANLRDGEATLRAYLASVANVVEEQNEVLAKLNLIKKRGAVMDSAIAASDNAATTAAHLVTARQRFDTFQKTQ